MCSKHTSFTSLIPERCQIYKCCNTCVFILQVWIGGLSRSSTKGKVYIVDSERYEILKELQGHSDRVTALCSAEDRYVLSGAGSHDGKIAIWKVE